MHRSGLFLRAFNLRICPKICAEAFTFGGFGIVMELTLLLHLPYVRERCPLHIVVAHCDLLSMRLSSE